MKNLLVALAVVLTSSFQANATRSLYVDDFANILGDVTAEDELLSYAQSNGIETLLLYELHIVNATYDITHYSTSGILADFISKAKNNFGILKMGAIGENSDFFWNVIYEYNNSRSNSDEKIDVLNYEFEFWLQSATDPGGYYCDTYLTPSGYPCTNDGAFGFVISEMSSINTITDISNHPMTTEMYIGWPTLSQTNAVCNLADRLLVHAYVPDPNDAYAYVEDRIIDISHYSGYIDVSIIFSSEPTFMQTWLENHTMLEAETIFYNDWLNGSYLFWWGTWMNLEGFTYFAYTFNQNVTVATEDITAVSEVSVSPNPVLDVLTIESEHQVKVVRVYDPLGKLILETNQKEIDVSQMKSGIYAVHIVTDENLEVVKIVKN